jgi:hypothetical protein
MSLIKLFLAGNTSGVSGIPGVFRSGKNPFRDVLVFPAGSGDPSLTFLTVHGE